MDTITNARALLRIYRLRKNWSLETLCQGICTASYLSKIEQGKVQPNRALLEDLFSKMGVSWQKITPEEGRELCDRLYELGTSKNYPFGFWTDLLPQQCVLKSPQYTKYSGLSKTFVGTKSLAQKHKK